MLNALLTAIKRIGRAFDPDYTAFSLTPAGRAGPLPEKPEPDRTARPQRKSGFIGFIIAGAIFSLLDYFFDLSAHLEIFLHWLWQKNIPQTGWKVIEVVFFLFLGVTALRLAGRCLWGVQRLHDLGRPARDIAPDLAWMLTAIIPVVVIAHGLDAVMELPTERSNLLASYIAALALWLAPFYMAFWSQHLKTWHERVETAQGDPGENRYGSAPSPASEPR